MINNNKIRRSFECFRISNPCQLCRLEQTHLAILIFEKLIKSDAGVLTILIYSSIIETFQTFKMESNCRICFDEPGTYNIFTDEFLFDSKPQKQTKIYIILNNFLHEKVNKLCEKFNYQANSNLRHKK